MWFQDVGAMVGILGGVLGIGTLVAAPKVIEQRVRDDHAFFEAQLRSEHDLVMQCINDLAKTEQERHHDIKSDITTNTTTLNLLTAKVGDIGDRLLKLQTQEEMRMREGHHDSR